MSYEKIMQFCESVRDKAHASSGHTAIGAASLGNAGFEITQFTFSEFRAACVGLCYTMTYRGMNNCINQDHFIFWDTLGRHLLDLPSLYFSEVKGKPFPEDDGPMRDLFLTTIKTVTNEWMLVQNTPISNWKGYPSPVGYPAGRFPIASYLAYPLLEAVLKRHLKKFVQRDGKVQIDFQPPYRTRPYEIGSFCSSVRDLLWLLSSQESSTDLGKDLQKILDHVKFLYPPADSMEVIYKKWRNPAMHGEDCVPTAYGIVLNLALLVAMSSVKTELSTRIGT